LKEINARKNLKKTILSSKGTQRNAYSADYVSGSVMKLWE